MLQVFPASLGLRVSADLGYHRVSLQPAHNVGPVAAKESVPWISKKVPLAQMLEGPEYVRRFGRLDDQDLFALVIDFLLDLGARRYEGVVVGWQRMLQTKQPEAEQGSPGEAKDTAVTAIDIDVSRRDREGAYF